MGRKIAQVIFVAVGLIFTFLAYVIGYNSGASNNYFDLMTNSAKAEDHSEMCKAFSMYQIPYDSNVLYEANHGEKNNIAVYNAINQLNLTYYKQEEDSTKSTNYSKVQYMYYFFIFNPQFDYGTVEKKNETGLKFYGDGDETYTFHYVVNSSANSNEYKTEPKSELEALFNVERNMVTTYKDYGFVFTSLSELFLSEVRNKIGGTITKFEVLDNMGNPVTAPIELKLEFEEQFFVDMADFKKASSDVNEIEQISVDERTNEQKAAYDNGNNYLNNFKIEDYKDKGYLPGFAKEDIYTTGLIWSSIGIAALFFVIVAVIYILVFYFKPIKNWIFGGHRRTNQRIVPNKMPNKANTADQKPKTNFDRLNEKRAEDLAKKRAKEEEIRKRGNMIAQSSNINQAPTNDEKIIDATIVEDSKDLDVNNLENQSNENESLENKEQE